MRLIHAIGALALVLAGCSNGLDYRAKDPVEAALPLPPGIGKLRLRAQTGIFEVVVREGPVVQVRGVRKCAATAPELLQRLRQPAAAPVLTVDPSDAAIAVLSFPGLPADPDLQVGLVAFEVQVAMPDKVSIDCQIEQAGQVTVDGRHADVTVKTGRGDLRVTACEGRCELLTGAGNTLVHDHRGDLFARAKAGEMQIWITEPGKDLRLVTGQGGVQCHIPADAGFRLDARTLEGKVSAKAFAIQGVQGEDYGAAMTGTHGDGKTEIVMRTGSGYLSLTPRPRR
jgi:hypothetical protein